MRRVLLLSTALLLSAPAVAADGMEDDAGTIVVTGQRDQPYRAGSITSATRTDTPLLDVPQAVTVLTKQRLDDQAMLSVQEALRFVPGAVGAQGEGNRDQIVLRGNNSTADFFVDGVRDDVQYFRDFYNLDRLEILKGSNAMIFGRGGGGGVINRVTKTPIIGERLLSADAAADTWGSWRLGGDVNLPVADHVAARLNGFVEQASNHRDFYGLTRWAVNPTLGFDLGGRGRLVLGYEHASDDRVADRGITSQNGRPAPVARSLFVGDAAQNRSTVNVDALTLAANYELADGLTLHNATRWADYDKEYVNLYAATPLSTAGTLGIEAYRDPTRRRNLFSQTDIAWKTDLAGMDHTLLAGFELGRQVSRNQRINGFFDGFAGGPTRVTVPLTDPFTPPPVTFRAGTGNRSIRAVAEVTALFVQDQVKIGEMIELVGGLRYDRFSLGVDNLLAGTRFARTDHLWSPRAGLVVKPAKNASLYASFSRSYLPQSGDQFTSLDASLAALEPEGFLNREIGAKWDITPALNLNIAAYVLDRTNTRAPGAVAGTVELTGRQRSRGIELGLDGQIRPWWQVQAGLAVQSARIVSTTSAAPAGRHVPLVPEFQASLWQRFQIAEPVGVGLGILHQGKSFTGISNTVELPAYTRVDGALFFKLAKGIAGQLNIENLFNTAYFPTAHTDNNISTGTPRTARLTIRTLF
ncbi:TonB-dependent siderophore receptor [Sphingomonas sp. IBVSS1]|nr:TonB-dependent siderophore receptor [Sphingomonas sp. IBVSS1]